MAPRYWIAIILAASHGFSVSALPASARAYLDTKSLQYGSELIAESSVNSDRKIDEIKSLLQQAEQLHQNGDIDGSVALNLKAADLLQVQFGKNNSLVAIPMLNIGITYQLAGRYAEALPYLENAFELRDSSLGRNHADIMRCLVAGW